MTLGTFLADVTALQELDHVRTLALAGECPMVRFGVLDVEVVPSVALALVEEDARRIASHLGEDDPG